MADDSASPFLDRPHLQLKAGRLLVAAAVVLVLAACDNGQSTPSARPSSTTSSAPPISSPATTSADTPSPETPLPADVFALHRYNKRMPDTWNAPVVIPYGKGAERLGTSLGGDGEGIRWGPSYGTLAPDGTWWILDSAKRRFAHFDATGTYLGQVVIPTEHLVNGRYVQWQSPTALADGTIVTYRLGGSDSTVLLLLHKGSFREVTLNRQFIFKVDDGHTLYGFGADGELLAVNPQTGKVTQVKAFKSRAGVPFRLAREGTDLKFALPDLGVRHSWPQVSAEKGTPAAGAISLASTADGALHVFIDGAADDSPTVGRCGYGVIDAHGTLYATESTRDPWSASDDGTGSRLVARPGGDEVWFIAIDPDAVRLYQRS